MLHKKGKNKMANGIKSFVILQRAVKKYIFSLIIKVTTSLSKPYCKVKNYLKI